MNNYSVTDFSFAQFDPKSTKCCFKNDYKHNSICSICRFYAFFNKISPIMDVKLFFSHTKLTNKKAPNGNSKLSISIIKLHKTSYQERRVVSNPNAPALSG